MGILLIESSSEKIEFGYAVEQEIIINEKLDINCNADTLTYFLKRSFENNNIKFGEIEFVSLSNGPGSFTGLRIGSAIAKGICFTTGSKLIEISTLDIIAGKYKSKKNIISLVTSNSRLSEFYYCEYSVNDDKVKRISEYKIDCAEKIFKQDFIYLINEDLKIEISPE
ncbi:MAG: tRNA (adenosine(37)-N6)-threonylcarbamoyltransferase complex dimerization subunit type 1 TsaB, partial [Ignavibacteria bacterium]